MSRKGKVINAPPRIFLQVAGDYDGPDDTEYSHISPDDITWHHDRIFDADVEYRLVRPSKYRERRATKQPVDAEGQEKQP